VTKRKPFDFLVERPFLQNGERDWHSLKPPSQILAPFLAHFMGPPKPFIFIADRLARQLA